jgi:hypothetical protein
MNSSSIVKTLVNNYINNKNKVKTLTSIDETSHSRYHLSILNQIFKLHSLTHFQMNSSYRTWFHSFPIYDLHFFKLWMLSLIYFADYLFVLISCCMVQCTYNYDGDPLCCVIWIWRNDVVDGYYYERKFLFLLRLFFTPHFHWCPWIIFTVNINRVFEKLRKH